MAEIVQLIAYLKSLSYDDQSNSADRSCLDELSSNEAPVGTKEFIQALSSQKNKHEEYVKHAKEKLQKELKEEIKKCYGITPEITEFINSMKSSIKKLDKLDTNKSDVERSASTWKIDRFSNYADRLKVRKGQGDSSNKLISHDTFRYIQMKYLQLASVYLGTDALAWDQDLSFLQKLLLSAYCEAVSRVFIDTFITPILSENKMQVRLEEKFYTKDLPNCIPDYVVYDNNGEVRGVIETKAGRNLKAESIIQCMLQLLVLRRTKATHMLFGVITNAVCSV